MNKPFTLKFTLAKKEDVKEIHTLCQSAAKAAPYSDWCEDYPNSAVLENDIRTNTLYKMEQDGEIISIMSIRPWAEFMKNEEADDIDTWDKSIKNPCALGRFCIAPKLQGKGYSRKIMQYTMEFAKELGYDGAFFHALKTDLVCLHIYDSMGYIRRGEVAEYGLEFVCYEHKF